MFDDVIGNAPASCALGRSAVDVQSCRRDCFGVRNSLIIKLIYHFRMILHVDFIRILYINPLQPCHMLLCAYNYLSACVHVYGCACLQRRRCSCGGWVTSTVFEAHVPQCLQVCAGHAHSIPIACSRATVSCVGFCDGRWEPCPVDPHDCLCSPCIQEERIPRLWIWKENARWRHFNQDWNALTSA